MLIKLFQTENKSPKKKIIDLIKKIVIPWYNISNIKNEAKILKGIPLGIKKFLDIIKK